ncbi:MAG: ROK family transcriptional regulator [Anaerolineae bacterium]|nr:ROK family transcriptional regulator [Anaerolineae bacterium]
MSQRNNFRTGDQTLVREINLSLIMNRLHRHTPISRAGLADMTGLNKSTVSSLVNELIEHRFIHELGVLSSGIGRPSVQLELNPQAGFIVSAEIGVGFVSVLCSNFTADIVWRCREKLSIELGQAAILDRVIALLHTAIEAGKATPQSPTLLGIAIGIPGLIDMNEGKLLFAPNLRWRNVPIRHLMQREFPDVPVFVDNEANMAALGEYFFGAAQDFNEILYLSAGVGLGGAIVRDGQLMRGTTGFAGEFGHMTMDRDGELCNCGNRGCWETQVTQSAVFRAIRQAIGSGAVSSLQPYLDDLTVQLVVDAAKQGDQVAIHTLNRVGHDLGVGIASLVNVLNPDLVLVGGIISLAGEFIMPVIETELNTRALRSSASAVTILPAKHSQDACVMGGVATVYQRVLSQPNTITHGIN